MPIKARSAVRTCLGTGATLLACETLGRECNGTENNPATFAVALQRYQDAFGIKPELVN